MCRALLICLTLALAPAAGVAAEVPRTVQLEYERQEGAASCPDDGAIRTGVAARLGYDPFRAKANERLRATIRQVGRVMEARIELADADGKVKARRRLVSRNAHCAELASSVELAIAIAIDPMVWARRPPGGPTIGGEAADVTSSEVAPVPEVAPAPSASLAPVVPGKPLATRLDLGLLGGMGFAPALNLGVRIGAALQGDVASLGIEARADLPAAQSVGGGRVSTALLVASLVPCAHVGVVSGCFLVTAGAQRVAGEELDNPRRATLPYLGLGVRLGLAVPIGARLVVAVHGDMIAPITETRLKVDQPTVWTSPTVAVALGAGVAMRFP